MIFGNDYTLVQVVNESKNSKVYEATQKTTNRNVVVKVHSVEFPTTKQLNKFRKEYEIGKSFTSSEETNILQYYDFLNLGLKNAIVMEKFGESLASFLRKQGRLLPEEAIEIAIQITDALVHIHENEIIHCGINPSHILIQQENDEKRVKICDFGFSTDLRRDHAKPITSTRNDLDITYISPEQTGRMNRDIDYRTDFYSLGVILYEMLTGTPPFKSNDVLELIYYQIAKTPTFDEHASYIPSCLQSVVLTLLSKSADDRYQSAHGVKQDLQTCLQRIRDKVDESSAPFKPKQHDVFSTFNLHQRLYGREEELAVLTGSFEKVYSGTVPRMLLLVAGYSGVGKTSLIQEVYKPLTRAKGYFISGKSDQLIRNIPFSCFIQAFKQLVDILLTEGESRLAEWKKRIMHALGQQAQVLIDLIPELGLIIGPQPPVQRVAGIESENRFKQLFQSFIEVFAQQDHPLVIFIDDLQWTDINTFKLIEEIMVNSSVQHFFLIGSYRSNEVTATHPLRTSLSILKRNSIHVEQINLKPLRTEHICQMLVDSLKTDEKQAMSLAETLHTKTQGNPFFLIQMLHFLVAEKTIRFNFKEAAWQWDLKQISAKGVTDNVIAMLISKIQKMAEQSQTILSQAAIIGNTFELNLLSALCGKSKEDTLNELYPYVKEGMVIQTGEAFRYLDEIRNMKFHFAHDKIQQASCELLSEEEQRDMHLRLGRAMMNNSSFNIEENMFSILSHFQYAQTLITDKLERLIVAEFSLQASKKAKERSAFHPAARYANFGISLLPPNSWEQHYQLTFDLYKQLCETEYLSRNYEKAEQLYEMVSEKAKTLLEKVAIYSIKSSQFEAQQRYYDSIMVILNSLKCFGIYVPLEKEKIKQAIKVELEEGMKILAGRRMPDLIDEPEMTSAEHRTALNLFVDTWSTCYCYGDHDLLALLSIMAAVYTMKHGHTEVSSLCYVIYSFVAGLYTNDYRHAYEAGQLGLMLLEKYPNETLKHRIFFVFGIGANCFIAPLKSSVPYLEKCHQVSVEFGDINYASYSCQQTLGFMFFSGEELQKLLVNYHYYMGYLRKNNPFIYRFGWGALVGYRWLIEYDPGDEEEVTRTIHQNSEIINVGVLQFGKVCKALWAKDKNAVEVADRALQICPDTITGCFHLVEMYFYAAMVYMEQFSTLAVEKQEQCLKAVDMVVTMYDKWSADNPGTFKHKLLLLKAERYRVIKGKSDDFIELLEDAIESATENGFFLFAGLGHEILASYWVSKNRMKYGLTHIQSAFYFYDRCGAKAKIRYLIRTYPDQVRELKTTNVDLSESSDVTSSDLEFDIHSVVKLSQAVSGEMNLDELLEHMMKIILENACSQRGIFILLEPGEKFLVVTETYYLSESKMVSTQNAVKAVPLDKFSAIPKSIVNYVARTKEPLVIGNISNDKVFGADPFFSAHPAVKSIICIPILKQNEFKGILYLENNSITNAFMSERLKVISLLGVQFTLHLENSRFSALLESEKKYKTLTAELQETKKKLEEFIDMLCHELRNPLNGIVGNQSILNDILHNLQKLTRSNHLSKQELIERISTYIHIFKETNESINISSNHMKDIIDTVLTVSMLENKSVKLQNVLYSPKEVVPQIGLMFKTKLQEKNLEFKAILPSEEIQVIGDPYRLKEIIINLVSNAIKFTQNGVICITMNVQAKTEDKIVFKFDIEDTGIGMTEEEQHRLFRSFSQANETTNIKYGGFGLGLKISKELVNLMGGEISVVSSKDKGTVFTFTITCSLPTASMGVHDQLSVSSQPVADQTNEVISGKYSPGTASSSSAASTSSSVQVNGKNILIVEDNLINQRVLVQIVKLLGHNCITAFNGLEACNIFKQYHDEYSQPIHCIFMDIQMPVMNGYDAAQKIRAYEQEHSMPQTPIVAVSANARPEHIQTAMSYGMTQYITKPYNKQEIYSMLRGLLDTPSG